MIKDEVRKLCEEGQNKINNFRKMAEDIRKSDKYTGEYKIAKNTECQNKIKEIVIEYSSKIVELFNNEIQRLESINYYKDSTPGLTSNILKMIELSKKNKFYIY